MKLGEYIGAGSGITKGLYHLEGDSNDSSGNENNGTDTGGVTYGLVYGKFSQGALYDGVDDRSALGAILTAAAGTIVWWMRPIATTNLKRPWSDTGGFIYPQFNGSSQMRLQYFDTATRSTGFVSVSTSLREMWAATWDSTTLILWKNGVNVASVAAGAIGSVAGNLQIGGIATVYANVEMDEFIVENYAWSPVQMQKHYTMALGRF